MDAIFDVKGASGESYRFRACAARESLPHVGGNYVFLRESGEGPVLLVVGLTEDLTYAGPEWERALRRDKSTRLFTRLNVSSAIRRAEHEDIVALHSSAKQLGVARA